MDELSKAFIGHGVLGLICLLLIYAVMRLYRDLRTLEDRYVTKADSWVQQHFEQTKETNELAAETNKLVVRLIDTIERMRPPKS